MKGAPIMIQNKKIAAVCVAEMQNDDIQSILYPLNEALSEIGWRMIIFDSCIKSRLYRCCFNNVKNH